MNNVAVQIYHESKGYVPDIEKQAYVEDSVVCVAQIEAWKTALVTGPIKIEDTEEGH